MENSCNEMNLSTNNYSFLKKKLILSESNPPKNEKNNSQKN